MFMNAVTRALSLLTLLAIPFCLQADNGTKVRIMSANLNGNVQSYQPFALRIFEGLKPDIVAIQEFNYGGGTDSDFRTMLDTAFGTNFVYYRETGYNIPNGVISRFPILDAGSWDDPLVNDRGIAWARISIPGTNDLYVVSCHLYSSGTATDRNTEASNIKSLVASNFPADAWVVVAGDFNTTSRSEAAITTFTTFLSDSPIPTDSESGGNPDTNEPRNKPYDYVLPSFTLAPALTSVTFPQHTFPNGLVFDSRVFTAPGDLDDFSPVLLGDSSNAQHMAVIKDFAIAWGGAVITTNSPAPTITQQPQSQTADIGGSVTFTVTATNTESLTYQWKWNGAALSGATNTFLSLTNVQATNAGTYCVVVANSSSSVTSSNAILTVNTAPLITSQPADVTVTAGQNASFSVSATGALPLAFQWRLNGADIAGATNNSYTRSNAQSADAGNYSVFLTNYLGTLLSSNAILTVVPLPTGYLAQWNFNSIPPDSSTATGTLTPSLGVGTASYLGGTTANSGGFATGSSTDPNTSDNTGWNTTTYPASTSANKTAGVRFDVSTAGKQNINIRWDQRGSGSASKYARLRYTTNGANFIDCPAAISLSSTSFESQTQSLAGFAGVDNNPRFGFCIVAEFAGTATNGPTQNYVGVSGNYATSGTLRFDMVTVTGSDIPPAITNQPATLDSISASPGQFQFGVTGQPGSQYVIEASTNLLDWIIIETNQAPFTFIDTNAGTASRRFYRAVSLP
jgi:endonuclease/exonuclease/phosphatase family metal-dependent hydrolase